MRVALVHDWLTGMRGGERCLEVFCELFPDADLFTLLHVKGSVSAIIEKHPIKPSCIQRLPFSAKKYRYYLPLFPFAIESFDFHGYDLVLSSSHCVAKGVRIPKGTCHISYIHTPMRYLWDQFHTYFDRGRSGALVGMVMRLMKNRLRNWDIVSTKSIHAILTNSHYVAKRIQTYYGHKANVVYPPVQWQVFDVGENDEGFYLMVTAFAPYKRVDLAIAAANRLRLPLKIVGTGQDEKRLKRLAGPTVEFLGWLHDQQVRSYYMNCRAVIFPGEEDFGIVPLEAMACGKPVIAYGKGGVLETVMPVNPQEQCDRGGSAQRMSMHSGSPTGVFFYESTPEALIEAIQLFERKKNCFDPHAIRAHVEPFDRVHFKERIQELILKHYKTFRQQSPC